MFGERVSPGPANQRSCHSFPCCWGHMLWKRHSLIHLTDYALSLSLSACYALASWCPSQRTRDNSKRRGLIACVQTTTPTANFWAQIILDPYRRPLTLTFLLVSTRGLFQDMMFDRLLDSTLSEDASEVLVQPLNWWTLFLYISLKRILFNDKKIIRPTGILNINLTSREWNQTKSISLIIMFK